jgi:hypothetical protein
VIIQDASPEIGGAPMTLISWIGQRKFPLSLNVSSRAITPLLIDETIKLFDCQKYRIKIVDCPLKLTLETNKQSFRADFRLHEIRTVIFDSQTPFQGIIICIQKIYGLLVSEPP